MWNLKEFESIHPRYESSGLKVRDFCANEIVYEAKFYYWQKKLRESKLPVLSFVPIVLDSDSSGSGLSCPTNADTAPSVIVPRNMKSFIFVELPCVSKVQ